MASCSVVVHLSFIIPGDLFNLETCGKLCVLSETSVPQMNGLCLSVTELQACMQLMD